MLWRFPLSGWRFDGTARGDGLDVTVFQIVTNGVAVVVLGAERLVGMTVMELHERIAAFRLVGFAARDVESQWVAFGVHAEMDFGREPASRTVDLFLILIPLLRGRRLVCPNDRGFDSVFFVGERI